MRRPGSPDTLVGVELVEVTDPDALPADTATAAPDDPALDPRRRRVRRWTGIGVVAALVVAGVTVAVADARRNAARREVFDDLGWVMPAMDGPLEEVWRAPGGAVLAQTDRMVVTRSDGLDRTMRAVDTATGQVLWEREDANEECWPVLDGLTQITVARYVASRPEMLMCVSLDAVGSDGTPPAEGASAPVAFLDLETGAVQGQVTVDGQLIGQTEVDGDILLFATRAERAVGVVRVDPRSGRVAWTWTSGPDVRSGQGSEGWTWQLDEDGDVLTIDGARTVAVSVDDGAEVDPGPNPETWAGQIQMASGVVVAGAQDVATGRERIGVLDADGATRFEVDGSWWWTWFDDGSVEDSLVVQQGNAGGAAAGNALLTGVDVDTGEERWSMSGGYSLPVFVLEGTAIVAVASMVGALDVEAGTWRWQHPVEGDLAGASDPVTDGDVVLVPVPDGGGRALAALDLRTGEERWRTSMPTDAFEAHLAGDGTLLLTTASEVVAYR